MKYYYFTQDPASCRASFSLSHSAQTATKEGWQWLNQNWLASHAQAGFCPDDQTMAINRAHPRWQEITASPFPGKDFRLNLIACGDIGSTVLIGLRLLAGDSISSIGIYDLHPDNCLRWEFELNQIAAPNTGLHMPDIEIIEQDQLFACDILVFCATAGVPPLDIKADVRMMQYQQNVAIISHYARQARLQGFRGLFAVVSDPVDQLCQAAFIAANSDDQGVFDGQGLFPEQIEGYGLGVMYARAAYYAQKDLRFSSFLSEGRAFGPHGQGLIIANSIANYDHALSRELTDLALGANLRAREMGFKPYIAPALSSAALNLLSTLRGEWHYSSTFLGGIFIGCRNRRQSTGIELEALALPEQLAERLANTASQLAAFNHKAHQR